MERFFPKILSSEPALAVRIGPGAFFGHPDEL